MENIYKMTWQTLFYIHGKSIAENYGIFNKKRNIDGKTYMVLRTKKANFAMIQVLCHGNKLLENAMANT